MPSSRRRGFGRGAATLAAAALLLAAGGEAAAQTFCSEPVRPLCVEDLANLDDALRRACLQDLDRYDESQRDFIACLEGALEAARSSLTDTRRSIGCLQGKGDCPTAAQ